MTNVEEFTFEFETGTLRSCSAILHGQMFIFGGDRPPFNDQISVVEDCHLMRLGTLPMAFDIGSCNTYQTSYGKNEMLLCFGDSAPTSCHRFLIMKRGNK